MDKGNSILIVEDDFILAERISFDLAKEGYSVCGVANNLQTANTLLRKHKVSLALVDIGLGMPEDGIVISKELLKFKPIPIIYITGDTSDKTVEKCKPTNPAAFLTKPLNMKELIIQIGLAIHNFEQSSSPFFNRNNLSDNIYIPSDMGFSRIKKNEILYIEADRVCSDLYLTVESFKRMFPKKDYEAIRLGINLGKVLDKLPSNFYKISRSTAINLDHIELIGKTNILIGSRDIDIPSGKRARLLEQLDIVRNNDKHSL
jgi:two-component system, response regulator PdtaR